jgi:probable HAF family extracellular repeat protein
MQNLGVLPGAWGSYGYDISNCLQVAGESGGRPFIWTPGAGMEEIPLPEDGSGAAYGINDLGIAVGYFHVWEGNVGTMRAFVYSPWEGLIDLGILPGTTHSMAQYVNNAGEVVGMCIDDIYQVTMFVWTREDGMRPLLEAVNPIAASDIFGAVALNEFGEILAQGTMPSESASLMRLMPVAASDLNFDHHVDLQDFSIFSGCFGLVAPGAGCDEMQHMLSDLDGNQKVDLNDFAMFSSEFGQ